MEWKQSVAFAVCAHVLYIALEHVHYRFCVGGASPWSFLYGVNAYSNFMCTSLRDWNGQIGSTLKGMIVSAVTSALVNFRFRATSSAGSTNVSSAQTDETRVEETGSFTGLEGSESVNSPLKED